MLNKIVCRAHFVEHVSFGKWSFCQTAWFKKSQHKRLHNHRNKWGTSNAGSKLKDAATRSLFRASTADQVMQILADRQLAHDWMTVESQSKQNKLKRAKGAKPPKSPNPKSPKKSPYPKGPRQRPLMHHPTTLIQRHRIPIQISHRPQTRQRPPPRHRLHHRHQVLSLMTFKRL